MRRAWNRGQSVSDYAIAVGAIALTMGAMQPFLQRMVQARIKDTADGLFTTEASDAPDFSDAVTNAERNQWGMDTQREGIDRRKAGTGLPGSDLAADFSTRVDIDLAEQTSAGRYGVAFAKTSRVTDGEAHFEGTRPAPVQTPINPRRWFKTEEQKKEAAHRWYENQQRKRERRQAEKARQQDWEALKEEARACYADPECREIFTDRQKYREFARRWNKLFGRKLEQQQSPYYLDPEGDPAAAFERWYGVPLEDAESGWSGEEYAEAPDWYGKFGPPGKKHQAERDELAKRQPLARSLYGLYLQKPTNLLPAPTPPRRGGRGAR